MQRYQINHPLFNEIAMLRFVGEFTKIHWKIYNVRGVTSVSVTKIQGARVLKITIVSKPLSLEMIEASSYPNVRHISIVVNFFNYAKFSTHRFDATRHIIHKIWIDIKAVNGSKSNIIVFTETVFGGQYEKCSYYQKLA